MKRMMTKRMNLRLLPWGSRLFLMGLAALLGRIDVDAQIVSFNFSATSAPTTGWVNVTGDPSTGVRTVTSNGITISSVATSNWSPYSGMCAGNGNGYYVNPGPYFPSTVMVNS